MICVSWWTFPFSDFFMYREGELVLRCLSGPKVCPLLPWLQLSALFSLLHYSLLMPLLFFSFEKQIFVTFCRNSLFVSFFRCLNIIRAWHCGRHMPLSKQFNYFIYNLHKSRMLYFIVRPPFFSNTAWGGDTKLKKQATS